MKEDRSFVFPLFLIFLGVAGMVCVAGVIILGFLIAILFARMVEDVTRCTLSSPEESAGATISKSAQSPGIETTPLQHLPQGDNVVIPKVSR